MPQVTKSNCNDAVSYASDCIDRKSCREQLRYPAIGESDRMDAATCKSNRDDVKAIAMMPQFARAIAMVPQFGKSDCDEPATHKSNRMGAAIREEQS